MNSSRHFILVSMIIFIINIYHVQTKSKDATNLTCDMNGLCLYVKNNLTVNSTGMSPSYIIVPGDALSPIFTNKDLCVRFEYKYNSDYLDYFAILIKEVGTKPVGIVKINGHFPASSKFHQVTLIKIN